MKSSETGAGNNIVLALAAQRTAVDGGSGCSGHPTQLAQQLQGRTMWALKPPVNQTFSLTPKE